MRTQSTKRSATSPGMEKNPVASPAVMGNCIRSAITAMANARMIRFLVKRGWPIAVQNNTRARPCRPGDVRLQTEAATPSPPALRGLRVMSLRFMLRPGALEIRKAGDHASGCSHQTGPVERIAWSRTRCRKVILAQLLYLRRNLRNLESGPRKVCLAGTPPRLFSTQAKPDAHTQISDEDRQDNQPECEGIEHGCDQQSFNNHPSIYSTIPTQHAINGCGGCRGRHT